MSVSVVDPAVPASGPPADPVGPLVRLPVGIRIGLLTAVILPFLGLVAAMVLLWGWGFTGVELGILAGMYLVTGLGITVGFHRYFTHRSFETNPVVQFLLGVSGSMAIQGPLLTWVAIHRRHHQHSDRVGDPHSPHQHGKGFVGTLRGLFHAHLGWMLGPVPGELAHYVKDLRRSAMLRRVDALFPLWIALGLVIPTALGGLLTWSWEGALLGLLWGGGVRICLQHHVTWSVNSVCHVWGRQPYASRDESRNNFLFGILALGEGWHNNHHAFPTSARHGLRWWQFDASYLFIRTLALFGLAWDLKTPPRQPSSAA